MFQTNQPSSDRSLHALLGIGLLHLHPTAHVRTLLPWSQRCRVPVAEGHNLMTPCRTEKVDFSKKLKKTESPKKNKSTGRITRRNKKQEKQNKNKKNKTCIFRSFCFVCFYSVFSCFFLGFGFLVCFFCLLWFCYFFVFLFFCQTLYSLCCWTHNHNLKHMCQTPLGWTTCQPQNCQ